jgi:equilibrative nucleoside transporter 1/2/3
MNSPIPLSQRQKKGDKRPLFDQILSIDDDNDDGSDEKGADQSEIRLASVLFALVGVGYLFPFSALTQPVDYWQLLFPDFNIEFPLTVIYMYTNLIMLAILVFFGGEPSFAPRIVGGFVGQLFVLIFVPSSYFWYFSERNNEIAILGATATVAIVTAFLDSSVIALACQYPTRVQESLQLGIGISTLVGSVYRDVTKLAFPPEETVESSLLYFYSGAATIAVCIMAYYKLTTLDLSKRCLAKAIEVEHEAHAHHDTLTLMAEGTPLVPKDTGKGIIEVEESVNKLVVLQKIWYNELMVCLLFMSTLALWPPLITEIPSFNFPSLQESGWWPLILLTVFSTGDITGRLLVRFRFGLNPDNIWIAVLGRTFLFPLIICSVQSILFTHDAFSVIFVVLLGMSNGYVGTLAIILVNEVITEAEQSMAGTFTSFALNSGLVFGATIGMLIEDLVTS